MVSLPCLPVLPCNRIGSTQEDTRAITRYAHPQCSNKISNKINVGPSPSISRKAITESARGTECKSAHGTAPAPSSGLPPEGVPSERDFPTVAEMVTNVNREAIRHYCGDSSSARVAPIERQRNPQARTSFPDFAEPVIGPATSGRTRWLIRVTNFGTRRATARAGRVASSSR
jgi:hypothetical protein